MSNEARTSFKQVWDELEVADKGVRFQFKLEGMEFWINKEAGIMRRLVAAERILKVSWMDSDGFAAGDYDNMVDNIMALVSQCLRDSDGKVYDKIDFKSDWRESIISTFDESIQITMLQNLPYSVAAVILGEARAALAMGDGLISQKSDMEAGEGLSSDT